MVGYMMAVVLGYCLLLFFVSLCAGTVLSFRLNRQISLGVKIVRSILLGFGIFIFLLFALGILMLREADRSHDYWRHRGYFIWPILSYSDYRIPLEYPYELYWGEGWVGAQIQSSDKQAGQPYSGIRNVLSLRRVHSFVLGEYSTSDSDAKPDAWFIFDCKNGRGTLFDDKATFWIAAEDIGVPTGSMFYPIKKVWKQFWANGSNWKRKPQVRVNRE
jgi:hypothetical protein